MIMAVWLGDLIEGLEFGALGFGFGLLGFGAMRLELLGCKEVWMVVLKEF